MVDPLEDVRILELTQMIAGPLAGMTLADLGADVIKIERPGSGEIARNATPKFGSESFYFLSVNRGKQSVSIDLKTDRGRMLFFDLVEDADVVLENFIPGTVDRLGIGYEDVKEWNPEIIYCSVSGFGQYGPKSGRPGVDDIIQAFTGVASLTRDEDHTPRVTGLPVCDLSGSMYAVIGVLEALYERTRTGEGEYLDVALSDSTLSLLSARAGYSFTTGEPFPPMVKHPYFAPVGFFETHDSEYLRISIVTENQWNELCRALDRPDLANDAAFESVDERLANRDELRRVLEPIFASRTITTWLERFEQYSFPFSKVNNTLNVWEDPQTQAREMVQMIETPDGEEYETIAYPVKHAGSDWKPSADSAARLGEHTAPVLEDLGYSPEEIDALRNEDIIR